MHKNKFNPANGNAFRFNDNENADVMVNRKKGTLKGFIVLTISILVGVIAGYLIASNLLS